ncbi:MAG: hypothetical protein AAGJ35_05625, partial [Myxococcota bacterium]
MKEMRPQPPTTTQWADVENLDVNVGVLGARPDVDAAVLETPTTDTWGWENTGRIGIGDIEYDERGGV